jgi:S-adenosylmethionine uptake transporter
MTQRTVSTAGIWFILAGMTAISMNDMLIKQLSGGYPLHQLVFTRSAIGLMLTLVLVQMEGGWTILKTTRPGLHLVRALMIVVSNMTFFSAIAVLPLAEATALFFAAPLFITLLSIPFLGEKVGPMRMSAVLIGFIGVLIMQRPWQSLDGSDANRLVLLLPVISALTYAVNQVMTRKLGITSKASALAVYIQVTFIIVSAGFFLVAGDGRFAVGAQNGALEFLLRAWVWPASGDWKFFLGLGVLSATVGYCLSQAYRLSDAATVAPFEYIGLPLAVFWGFMVFGEWPDLPIFIGILLIMGAGLFVFLRERALSKRITRPTNMRR